MNCRTSPATWLIWLVLASPAAAQTDTPLRPAPVERATAATPLSVAKIVELVRPSLATIRVDDRDGNEHGIGTGFVISREGLLATNLHVIPEGRPFAVELASGRRLQVLGVEASDQNLDLALVRVAVDPETPLAALRMSPDQPTQGTQVVAMGNPWGLRNSVVSGVVSALREMNGRKMIQLAMPIEPGNSGGPVVNRRGEVVGVVNMKSAVEQNVAFAQPVEALRLLLARPNPVTIDRWSTIGALDLTAWTPLFGGQWRQRSGRILVSGGGEGFGGRALCLQETESRQPPFELAVSVRLDDESGAAGLVFHADGRDRHYGFYPSNGKLRLSCFRGPTVFSWQVLEERPTEHYRPGDWNELKVRVETEKMLCYVNSQLVFESRDQTFRDGKVGLAKFRNTRAEFKRFRVGEQLPTEVASAEAIRRAEEAIDELPALEWVGPEQVADLAEAAEASSMVLQLRARKLAQRADQLRARAQRTRRLARDLDVYQITQQLKQMVSQPDAIDLLRGALLIARLEEPDIDIEAYIAQVDRMAAEIRKTVPRGTTETETLAALNQYLFAECGYHGSRFEYEHRANSFINRVIDDREGLPITLSVLYLELGRRLGLEIEGIGLPGRFVVRFMSGDSPGKLIDVFAGGAPLTREAAAELVRSLTDQPLTDDHLRPAASTEILARMLRNLLRTTENENDREAMLRVLEALVAIEPGSVQWRGLRAVVRSETGRRAGALADLDWILENEPPAVDLERIRQMRRFFQRRP